MTSYLSLLIRREKTLQKRLISNRVIKHPLTDLSQDMLRTYRLLVHAEIEHYLEKISIEAINKAKAKWNTHKKPSTALLTIVAYSNCNFPNVPSALSEISSKNDLNYRLNQAVNSCLGAVKRNNGIKETDIIPILVRLGVDYNKISQTLLNNLSSYGSLRGEVAHNSYKVVSLIDPINEKDMVKRIIDELNDIDKLINAL